MRAELEEIKAICEREINSGNHDIETHHVILAIVKSKKRDKFNKIYGIALDELYREGHSSFSEIADISMRADD